MTDERALRPEFASRFARLALSHVRREYPNAPHHVLDGPADLKPPRELHPLFYGSFDWHSCVHSYWLLATLYRVRPEIDETPSIRTLFDEAVTPLAVEGERAYLRRAYTGSFERPYGWAWLLMLAAELARHETEEGRRWCALLRPLAEDFVARFRRDLPKLTYPIRSGTHSSTAFALALASEYTADRELQALIGERARAWFADDADCQAWEPSGEDFLSPALTEAECLRRILPAHEFRAWFARFLPRAAAGEPATLFASVHVEDRHDGRIVHLDGLNLSRAWCWRGIASVLNPEDAVLVRAREAADRHLAASLPSISGDYMGEHWLASFALLALRAAQG
jgi:Protein of unknown function (DUF2891)